PKVRRTLPSVSQSDARNLYEPSETQAPSSPPTIPSERSQTPSDVTATPSWETVDIPPIPSSGSSISTLTSGSLSSVPTGPRPPPSPSRVSTSIYYVSETDRTYNSSVLEASRTSRSTGVPEGPDFSFDTSFLRPSTSPASSGFPSGVHSITVLSRSPSSVSTASGTSMTSPKLD